MDQIKQPSAIQNLLQRFAPSVGGGMAGQAAQVIQSRPYQLHVQEMRAQGMQPLTPEQYVQQTQGSMPKRGLLD